MGSVVEDFMNAVEEGLKLSKRIFHGKYRVVASASAPPPMSKSPKYYLPMASMVYAVIYHPGIVDNPDIPSYQPYVHGQLDPPAVIPLPMMGVTLQVDCYLDTVFVRISGHWRVHCVMGSKSCDCRVAVPMGEQGSILGVEVDVQRNSYRTQLALVADKQDDGNASGGDNGVFLKPHVFMLTIPQVDGGTNLHIRLSWSQKLVYRDGEFSLCLPFSFPEYVAPANKKIPKKEKIELNVHPGDGNEVLCKSISHPLKEHQREVGKLSFLYELDVFSWSSADFSFSYSLLASHTLGNVVVRSPSIDDIDQRDMFYIHILPGSVESKKVFTKIIVFVVDISGSVEGKPVEDVKRALYAALCELNPEDSFNIIAFNGQTFLFSSSLRLATQEVIEDAIQWIGINFVAGEGTSISLPSQSGHGDATSYLQLLAYDFPDH
ncbi:hypothetical protein Cgig2_009629 [Carnegiea gigantea]|uniref:VWFA domain-containing protein n=1 Tax=Carnegiea gigantea TaxID=171969 RepID=A0A9Q1Q6G2_9CARY|nr:hypothetical protein Cgig2_009629 [Carnegiea gigantea]